MLARTHARTCARTHALALARLTLGGMMAEGKRKHNKRVAYVLLTSIADSIAQLKRISAVTAP
jgi:hypothetical protein